MTGFNELVGRVCCGAVGAVFGLEVSRLARSTADLQRLLESAAIALMYDDTIHGSSIPSTAWPDHGQ